MQQPFQDLTAQRIDSQRLGPVDHLYRPFVGLAEPRRRSPSVEPDLLRCRRDLLRMS